MLTDQEKRKLKRHVSLYSSITVSLSINETQEHYCQKGNISTIVLGSQAPYLYNDHFSLEGYELFMEGLNFHEIARLRYSQFSIINETIQESLQKQQAVNNAAKQWKDKLIKYKDFYPIVLDYVKAVQTPLILNALEEGAVENALGIEYPETWNALMYARGHIVKSLLKRNQKDENYQFLMEKITQEIMAICTYGYRFSLKKDIIYLPKLLPLQFEEIRHLAIKGRLITQNTLQRLEITKNIIELCLPILHQTVKEIIDTIEKTSLFSHISLPLASKINEISVNFSNDNSNENIQETKSLYQIDLSKEELQRIEALEEQNEKVLQQQILQELFKREKQQQLKEEENIKKGLKESPYLKDIIHNQTLRTTLSSYGQIAFSTQLDSIKRSNQIARLFKRERMYASKNQTKHKLEYGKQLDQRNLYHASIDGKIFMNHQQGKKKDLCVYILVDNSESMSGDKIINAMKGCFELARVMQTLNIPFCISSHKTISGTQVQMNEIVSFKDCKKRNKLDQIYYMHVSGGTHEEIALEYALKQLTAFKRQRKGFVFVLSDGDTHGVDRIHELTHIYKKEKDIDVIGIGIQPAYKIKDTYPNSIFVENIQLLGDVFMKKLKEIAIEKG